jgi:putative ABC transport system permease protein
MLFRQLLAESMVLSLIGCVSGIALGWGLLKIIMATMPPFTLPSLADVRLNIPVLLFTVALSLFAGVLFGCAPAWQATRMNLNDALKGGGRSATNAGRHRLRHTLVVVEFGLALTLLTAGGLSIRSLWNVAHIDLGFRSDHLLTCFIPVPEGQMTDPAQSVAFYRELHDRISALAGVTSMSASEGMPFRGVNFALPFSVEGSPIDDPSRRSSVGFNMVTPEYFKTFGIFFEKGRALTEEDRAGGIPTAVVNEAFAKKFLSDSNPFSQRVLVDHFAPGAPKLGPPIAWQIVGVYRDTRSGGLHGGHFPEIDVPFAQNPWPEATIAVRTAGDPTALRNSIADIVQSLNPNLPITDVKTMDQIVDDSKARDRFTAMLFGSFAGVALLLAAFGIYGVISFAVAQRTHEIGLRMALGADSRSVLMMILREGMASALIGAALGFFGAYFVGRGMQTLLVGVGNIDFVTFTTVAALLLASALLACYVPARRATSVDPMQALRQE